MPPPAPIPCTYTVFIVPAEHKPAADLVMALIFGDDPALSTPFSVGTNADGDPEDPIECYHGGQRTDLAWQQAYTAAITSPPTPPGGWPWNGIAEQDALSAMAAVELGQATTANGTGPDANLALSLALQHYGQSEISYPPDEE